MIAAAHLHLRQNIKRRSAHVRIRYMRYAVQVATYIEKTTHYPENLDRMKITTRRRNRDRNRKNHTSEREEKYKQFKSGKEAIGSKKARIETHERIRNCFADCRLACFARGVEQR